MSVVSLILYSLVALGLWAIIISGFVENGRKLKRGNEELTFPISRDIISLYVSILALNRILEYALGVNS